VLAVAYERDLHGFAELCLESLTSDLQSLALIAGCLRRAVPLPTPPFSFAHGGRMAIPFLPVKTYDESIAWLRTPTAQRSQTTTNRRIVPSRRFLRAVRPNLAEANFAAAIAHENAISPSNGRTVFNRSKNSFHYSRLNGRNERKP
jgi:hypothetical protein